MMNFIGSFIGKEYSNLIIVGCWFGCYFSFFTFTSTMQIYNMSYGKYLTSFFRIYIDTDIDLGHLKSDKLGDKEKGVFVHEYTHFLQNITSVFGLVHIWNTYDRLRQYIANIAKSEEMDLQLPLTGEIADQQRNLLIIRKMMEGDTRVPNHMNDKETKITGHTYIKDEIYSQIYPDRPELLHLELELQDNIGVKIKYIFGEIAISETMAYLMEQKYYAGDPAPEYPYRVCQHLSEYLGTDLLDNNEILFALSDVSLLSAFPGKTFFQILKEMVDSGYVPKTAEQVFDYGISFLYRNGWQVFEEYEKNMDGAKYVITKLLPHQDMEETIEWIIYLLRAGFKIRKETPYVMIKLYREPKLFDGYWNNIMLQFGNPSLHNNSPIRYFKAPDDLSSIEDKIEPIHLLAVQEIRDTLIREKNKCELYSYCEKSKNGLKVDDRCLTSPWERAKDIRTCSYGALWKLYGLDNKNVIQ
jgi:hypothetical protein